MNDHCAPGSAAAVVDPRATDTALLIGAPNAGKSSLFNQLTGGHAKTGNYPGITVSRSIGTRTDDNGTITVEDLPGTYNLTPISPDEVIVVDALQQAGHAAEDSGVEPVFVVVVDAQSLRRSLRLVGEVLQREHPTLVAVTMLDELVAHGGHLDLDALSTAIGVPVVASNGRVRNGADAVIRALQHREHWARPAYPPVLEHLDEWAQSVIERARYRPAHTDTLTARVDRILLHPVFGTVIFGIVLVVFFQVIFTLATPLQDLILSGLGELGTGIETPFGSNIVTAFVNEALVDGVGTVLSFVPQIALLFVLITVLEQTGYLTRAAFLMDRIMAWTGLEGRAFVAILSSFACAIPGILATRTLPDAKSRFTTMMTLPLITCSARLPVYTIFVSMLVPSHMRLGPMNVRGLVMLALYLLGAISMMVAAKVVALVTQRRDLIFPFVMEMPPYRLPNFQTFLASVGRPVMGYIKKVGKIILSTTLVIWLLLNVPFVSAAELSAQHIDAHDQVAVAEYTMQQSVAADIGRFVAPVFDPLGFDWRVNVAILSSLSARETFVATLGQINGASNPDNPTRALQHMQYTSGPHTGEPIMTPPTIVAVLVFFVYALQCMSTVATLRRETDTWRWPLAALGGYGVLAWCMAWLGHLIAMLIV